MPRLDFRYEPVHRQLATSLRQVGDDQPPSIPRTRPLPAAATAPNANVPNSSQTDFGPAAPPPDVTEQEEHPRLSTTARWQRSPREHPRPTYAASRLRRRTVTPCRAPNRRSTSERRQPHPRRSTTARCRSSPARPRLTHRASPTLRRRTDRHSTADHRHPSTGRDRRRARPGPQRPGSRPPGRSARRAAVESARVRHVVACPGR